MRRVLIYALSTLVLFIAGMYGPGKLVDWYDTQRAERAADAVQDCVNDAEGNELTTVLAAWLYYSSIDRPSMAMNVAVLALDDADAAAGLKLVASCLAKSDFRAVAVNFVRVINAKVDFVDRTEEGFVVRPATTVVFTREVFEAVAASDDPVGTLDEMIQTRSGVWQFPTSLTGIQVQYGMRLDKDAFELHLKRWAALAETE